MTYARLLRAPPTAAGSSADSAASGVRSASRQHHVRAPSGCHASARACVVSSTDAPQSSQDEGLRAAGAAGSSGT